MTERGKGLVWMPIIHTHTHNECKLRDFSSFLLIFCILFIYISNGLHININVSTQSMSQKNNLNQLERLYN